MNLKENLLDDISALKYSIGYIKKMLLNKSQKATKYSDPNDIQKKNSNLNQNEIKPQENCGFITSIEEEYFEYIDEEEGNKKSLSEEDRNLKCNFDFDEAEFTVLTLYTENSKSNKPSILNEYLKYFAPCSKNDDKESICLIRNLRPNLNSETILHKMKFRFLVSENK